MQQAPAKKSQKRPAADAAEESAAAAAAEARLMEREEEEENEISFHILCYHGKFLPPILRSVVTLVVIGLQIKHNHRRNIGGYA